MKLTDMDRAMLGAIIIGALRPVKTESKNQWAQQDAMLGDQCCNEYTIKFVKWRLMSSDTDDGCYHLTQKGLDAI